MKKIIIIAIIILLIPVVAYAEEPITKEHIEDTEDLELVGQGDGQTLMMAHTALAIYTGSPINTGTNYPYIQIVFFDEEYEQVLSKGIDIILAQQYKWIDGGYKWAKQLKYKSFDMPDHVILAEDLASFSEIIIRVEVHEENEEILIYLHCNISGGIFEFTQDISGYLTDNPTIEHIKIRQIMSGGSFDRYSSDELVAAGPQEPEPCFQYTIEFEHFTEALVRDNTWLHNIFYDVMEWDNAFRYSSTVRILDAYGKTVEGYLAPVPLTIYGIESLGWAWPPRQFNTFEEYWNEEKLNTPRFHIKSSSFKNIYWVGEVEPNLAKQAMIWVFEPVDPKYKRGVFTWYLYEHRDALGIHQDYTLWPEPYYQIQYEFSYMHTVTCEHDEFEDTDITDMDETWADEWEPQLPDMGWDDRVYPERLFQKVTEIAAELVETFNNKAPFGYLVMFFNVLQDFPDDIDNQDVTLDIPFMEQVIEMDLTPDYMSDIFSTIRLFSGWVLYAFLGFFFYKEYRKITGSGGEG